jgi:archaellum component FlaC
MRSGDVALRLSIVFSLAGFIALVAGLYEIDRREKSSSKTLATNVAEIEQRVHVLSNQIRILNDQYTRQLTMNEQELRALSSQIQALTRLYDSRLKQLENDLRLLRSESAPVRR